VERGEDEEVEHEDCFLVSGSKVLEGVGEYVVIAVGTRSFNGRIMMGSFFHSLHPLVTDGGV
jgi:Ca2+-transporting ATPase